MKRALIRITIAVLCLGATALMGWVAFDLILGEKPIFEGTLMESIPQPWQNVLGAILLIVVLLVMGILSVRIIIRAFSMEKPEDLFQRDSTRPKRFSQLGRTILNELWKSRSAWGSGFLWSERGGEGRAVPALVFQMPGLVVGRGGLPHSPEDFEPALTEAAQGTGVALTFGPVRPIVILGPRTGEARTVGLESKPKGSLV
jgi:NADH:ubiquinone oxidoreductase subunit 5 (subunit L)/multisubunit Na+/H+ antiporter MnhA subunit